MKDLIAAILFAGFLGLGLWATRAPKRNSDDARRRVSLFVLYALAASFGAGLTQRDFWPFSAWPLVAGLVPETVTHPRLMAVDAGGAEHDIDYRAWSPMSVDELLSWVDADFMTLRAKDRDAAAAYLLRTAEGARAAAASGAGVRRPGLLPEAVGAPFFLLHPARWTSTGRTPPQRFTTLRFYRESWNVEARTRGDPVRRLLVYEYPRVR